MNLFGLEITFSKNGKGNKYQDKEVCALIHKSIDEKLEILPKIERSVTQIETKLEIYFNNGNKLEK